MIASPESYLCNALHGSGRTILLRSNGCQARTYFEHQLMSSAMLVAAAAGAGRTAISQHRRHSVGLPLLSAFASRSNLFVGVSER
jgi:hypothetical protein